jgi:EPS-associated MarR family transcriptional regulator
MNYQNLLVLFPGQLADSLPGRLLRATSLIDGVLKGIPAKFDFGAGRRVPSPFSFCCRAAKLRSTLNKSPQPPRMTPQQLAHFRILHLLEQHPEFTQRELSDALGVSVGKANYLINSLVDKGHIKIEAFRCTGDKLNKIAYLLTPEGLSNRMALTRDYLERTTREYEALKAEIDSLQAQLADDENQPRQVIP